MSASLCDANFAAVGFQEEVGGGGGAVSPPILLYILFFKILIFFPKFNFIDMVASQHANY